MMFLLAILIIATIVSINAFLSNRFHVSRACPLKSSMEKSLDTMTVDEIKSELELRAVTYDDCISKSQLVQRLSSSRVQGKANPKIIDQFNNAVSETTNLNLNVDDADLSEVTSKDGKLPGGLSPAMVKALTSDPDIMRMLQDPKMQDVMKAVMTNGPSGIKKYLSDPDALTLLQRLSKAMEKATGV